MEDEITVARTTEDRGPESHEKVLTEMTVKAVTPLNYETLRESTGSQAYSTGGKPEDDKVTRLERHLEAISKLSIDFLALLSASTVIATFGLFENSAAVIIGAMIIAPLMRPLVGLSLALLTADMLLLRRATLTLAVGTLVGAGIAFILAHVLNQIELTPEILARTKPTLLDLGIAFFAGAIGAYCQSKPKLGDSLAGVAIAVALVPPLSVVGIGLALNQTELWQGSGLLYLTNLVGITIAGAMVFLIMGYAPLRRAKKGIVISAALVALLAVPLAVSMNALLLENRLNGEIREVLKRTHTFKEVRLRDVEIRKYRKPPLVLATVFADQQINGNQVRMVQQFLIKELNMPLEFRIKVIPVSEIRAMEEVPDKPGESLTTVPALELSEEQSQGTEQSGIEPSPSNFSEANQAKER